MVIPVSPQTQSFIHYLLRWTEREASIQICNHVFTAQQIRARTVLANC